MLPSLDIAMTRVLERPEAGVLDSRPSLRRIADANDCLVTSLRLQTGDPIAECWACRYKPAEGLERAHVVADSHGGSNDPSNFFLLCSHCHEAQPDGATREQQEQWLRTSPYWTEWVDGLIAKVISDARRLVPEITDAQVDLWKSRPEALAAIQVGYAAAAGWSNAHGNVSAVFAESMRAMFGADAKQ